MTKSETIQKLNYKLKNYFQAKSELRASDLHDLTLVDHIHLFVYSTDKSASWKFAGKLSNEDLFIEGRYQGDDWILEKNTEYLNAQL
jgi:hypothetical protein